MTNIAEWLASLGMSEYAGRFAENAIDLSVIHDLTEQDLTDIGVKLGHRRKLLRAIADLQHPIAAAQGPAPRAPAKDGAERRELTVMFCDLVGSTSLTSRLDPEDMRQVIQGYQGCMSEIISRRQGMVARYQGDGALVYFGYPQAHEDDAVQAIRAALELVDAVAALPNSLDAALQLRVGIATGTVVVGDILVTEGGGEQAVIGDTPNLASRLQTVAEAGTVAICANTRHLAEGYFKFHDLGLLPLRGWAEPIQAWRVLGTTGVESRFEATHKTNVPPLVGRGEEIEMLMRRWRDAAQGEGRVILLTGEPGIGKSHITLALEERLQAVPHITVRNFCSAHHLNSALFPFISQIERAAQFERSDAPSERFTKLESLLAQSNATAEEVALLADLLKTPLDARYSLPEMTPQKHKEKTLAALMAQLKGLAARRPVLCIFEDVHWIDPTSLELLSTTVERAPELRLLMLITARPEFTPPWPEYSHVTTLSLTRLSRREGASLVAQVTGGKTLPEDVMNQILARTDGVPLFVEELTKTVLESGLLTERAADFVLQNALPSMAIPTTLHASLMARLDRLASVKEVAQIGAVIGREFSYELLNAVAGVPQDVLDLLLEQLVRSELVFRRGEMQQAVYIFKHVLVRDAAYSGLLKTRRARLHVDIAEAIEQRFPEIAEAQPETLAHHFTEAGNIEKATGYWLKAGNMAALRSANLEAIAHLHAGIDVLARAQDNPGRDRQELDIQFALAPCLIATQGPASSESVTTFTRARELCERLDDPPEYLQVMFWLATASVVRGELPQANEAIETLLRLATTRGNRPALLNAMRGQGMILLFMGQVVDAHKALERAVSAFDESDESARLSARVAGQDAGVANLSLMSWALWVLGRADEAVARIDAAVRRAEMLQHPHTEAYACYYAAILHGLRGEPSIALERARRCLALSGEHGFLQWRGLAQAVQGICTVHVDGSSSTLDEVKSAVDEYRGRGYRIGITALYVLLCPVLLRSNQAEAALEIIEQGLVAANNNTERVFEAELYRLKAQVMLSRGGEEARLEAQSLLDQALTTARAQNAKILELRAATDLAAIWIGDGRREAAFQLLAPVYFWFREGFDTPDLRQAETLLDQL